MPYLVVLVVDNSPYEAGDVISWRPEGSQSFGIKMLAHPWFRVIHCPDMSNEEADALTTPQLGDRKVNPELKHRAFKLDLNIFGVSKGTELPTKDTNIKWDSVSKVYIAPEDITVIKNDIISAKLNKEVIISGIGVEENVIG